MIRNTIAAAFILIALAGCTSIAATTATVAKTPVPTLAVASSASMTPEQQDHQYLTAVRQSTTKGTDGSLIALAHDLCTLHAQGDNADLTFRQNVIDTIRAFPKPTELIIINSAIAAYCTA